MKRAIFVVLGPPKRHGDEWRHPILFLRCDNRPDLVGRESTSSEPKRRFSDIAWEDNFLEMDAWEEASGMTRIA
jgi:hypothetical protein